MYFTQEDYRKIERWLLSNSRKDTDFAGAAPLKGNETVVFVQDGKNVKTSVKDIVDQFFLHKIVQELGTSESLIMSQKAVTDDLTQVRSDLSSVSLLSANIRTYDAGVIPTIENGTDNDYKQAAINLVPESLRVGGMTVLYSKQGDITKKSIFLPLSSFSTNISEWENRASLVRQENKSILENAVTIKPNVFNKWGEMLALDITLGFEVSNELNEYMIEFVSGETPTVFSLQGSVKWADGILVPEPNMTYQISIVNGLAIYAGWSNI